MTAQIIRLDAYRKAKCQIARRDRNVDFWAFTERLTPTFSKSHLELMCALNDITMAQADEIIAHGLELAERN